MQLFWERGFEATSKRDLMEATGLASQSLYNAFADKLGLYLEALRHYADTRYVTVASLLEGPGSPLENLRSLIRMWSDVPPGSEFEKGCFLCNALAELDSDDGPRSEFLRGQLERIRSNIAGALTRAQACGEIGADIDIEGRAAALVCVSNGIALLRRTGAPKALVQNAAAGALALLS